MSRLINPWPQFNGPNGQSYDDGSVYFGDPNTDPVENPKAPFSDKGLTVAVGTKQTLNDRGAFDIALFFDGAYSMSLFDKQGNFVVTEPEVYGNISPISADDVTYLHPGAGAVESKQGALMDGSEVNVLYFMPVSNDIGVAINAATAAGLLKIYIPPGSYTQSTPLTSNQEVHLFTMGSNLYGFNPAIITKDFEAAHLETTVGCSSVGIEWSGLGVSGNSSGWIMHSKFYFEGSITDQPGHGLEIIKNGTGHNSNSSVIRGAFASNGFSGIVIEDTVVSNSDNINLNVMDLSYCRCNSNGRDGVTFRAGLFNRFYNLRCDGNARYGFNINASNLVSSNYIALYTEDNGPTGSHTGGTDPVQMTDSTQSMDVNAFVGFTIKNNAEGDVGNIISNTATTITVDALSGPGDNQWESGDTYTVTSDINMSQTALNNLVDNEVVAFRGLMPDTITSDLVADADFYFQGNTARLGRNFRGVFVNSKQPWSKFHQTADVLNVTGNGTPYTMIYGTKIKDTQNGFDSVSTYTAITTGRYSFSGAISLGGLVAGSHTRCQVNLVTSNRTYFLEDFDLDNAKSSNDTHIVNWSVPGVDMDSNDTATVTIAVTGGALDVDIFGDASAAQTYLNVTLEG